MDTLRDLWDRILERVSTLVNSQSYQTWFKPTRLVSYEGGRIVIEGPNPFFVDWLAEHHLDKIEFAASETLGETVKVEFVSPDSPRRVTAPERSVQRSVIVTDPVTLPNKVHLNARYTFDEFVVGGGNRLAHAAALAVSEKPARAYNPLFIYGGVGLGKTHLIQAIGHRVLKEHPTLRISYVSAESFMNELIHAIRKGVTLEFKERYRNIDILMIDDIQFLAGKESTQEEFFFTFNALHDANKQIVVTSDRPPKEIPTLQERLTSRFEWGLITDIQPPDLETRIAILRKKVENEHIPIPEDVISLIAENVKSNIRELEGSLIRILACSSLACQEINVDMASNVLRDIVKGSPKKKLDIRAIQRAAAQHFDIPVDSLKAKTRVSRVVLARQVAIFLSRELTDLSLVQIGKQFGGRDHSTILHACKKIERAAEEDAALRRKLQTIRSELSS
ncbi:MAG TPA: chromosomal replication initiator protein DnaA [Candidatus Eisenbacteria bacterium]|uniref:Chromosomal replication initiator protein DnaA n=1 Tax=Eiseniibacteriota bacterium TaxID=2212470 RepID=A0A7V2AW17_UNCEI|nr:chromosomal replication initiator protein DnaA [Candidatus Eisenbacteria bacterium]